MTLYSRPIVLSLISVTMMAQAFSPINILSRSCSSTTSSLHALQPQKGGIVVESPKDGFIAKDPLIDEFMGRKAPADGSDGYHADGGAGANKGSARNGGGSRPSQTMNSLDDVWTQQQKQKQQQRSPPQQQPPQQAPIDEANLAPHTEMRLREIQAELKQRNVSYADCFDRDSLVKKLLEARGVSGIIGRETAPSSAIGQSPMTQQRTAIPVGGSTSSGGSNNNYDATATTANAHNASFGRKESPPIPSRPQQPAAADTKTSFGRKEPPPDRPFAQPVPPNMPPPPEEEATLIITPPPVETSAATESALPPPPSQPRERYEAPPFDRQATLADLRSQRVKELKAQLSQNNIRWGTMLEKEDMVQALINAMEQRHFQSLYFSKSGELIPGRVVDVDEALLMEELGWDEDDIANGVITAPRSSGGGEATKYPPILLDVYATW